MTGLLLFVYFGIAIAVVAAWMLAVHLMIKAVRMKGHYVGQSAAMLWFVGIFATPIALGLYAAALPDASKCWKPSSDGTVTNDELPDL